MSVLLVIEIRRCHSYEFLHFAITAYYRSCFYDILFTIPQHTIRAPTIANEKEKDNYEQLKYVRDLEKIQQEFAVLLEGLKRVKSESKRLEVVEVILWVIDMLYLL